MIIDDKAYDKLMRVVNSVQTPEQVKGAIKYIALWTAHEKTIRGWGEEYHVTVLKWIDDLVIKMWLRVDYGIDT